MLAVSRNPRVIGRTEVLKNSMIEIKGASHKGVPKGRNWPKNFVILYVALDKIIESQVTQAALKEKIVWTVVGKKYGFILKILRKRIEKNRTRMNANADFRNVFFELESWLSQMNSREEKETFLAEEDINKTEKSGASNRVSKIIKVGATFKKKFVQKSKEEKRSFIIKTNTRLFLR